MTLRVIEGWDYFPEDPVDALLGAAGWSGDLSAIRCPTTTAFGYGRSSHLTGGSNFNSIFKFLRGRYTTTYVLGMRMNVPTIGIPSYGGFGGLNGVYGLMGRDVNSSRPVQWQLGFDQFGTITLINYTDGVGAIFAASVPWSFVPGNWFYLEIKITPGYTTGAIEVKVNTVPVLSLVNIRISDGTPLLPETQPGITHQTIFINRIGAEASSSNDYFIDDFYMLTADGAQNNDYLGNVRVKYMPVIGNSTPLGWTIGGTAPAATNWQSVLNTNVDDTRYVYALTAGDEDFYQIDPNLNTPTVFGVEVAGAYKQDDATQRFVANQIRSGTTTRTGISFATNASYTFAYDIYELNPNTGLGWTGAEVNAAVIGPKVIT